MRSRGSSRSSQPFPAPTDDLTSRTDRDVGRRLDMADEVLRHAGAERRGARATKVTVCAQPRRRAGHRLTRRVRHQSDCGVTGALTATGLRDAPTTRPQPRPGKRPRPTAPPRRSPHSNVVVHARRYRQGRPLGASTSHPSANRSRRNPC
jgi:hypothetical protein